MFSNLFLYFLTPFNMGKKLMIALGVLLTAGSVVFAATMTFQDVPEDHWAFDSVEWNNSMGIMTGPGDMHGMFDPAGVVNRAQLATVNMRIYEALMDEIDALEARVAVLEGTEVAEEPMSDTNTIADAVVADENLSTLLAALEAADLVATFQDEEADYTVFAPTNDAFAVIQATVDTLLMPENKSSLQDVLTFHVVDGGALSGDLTDGMELTTLQGDTLLVEIVDEAVYVGGAMVTTADLEVDNGVIHVIDTVLVP